MTACTEKEAAEKWCPHARVIWVLGGEAAPGVGNVVFHSDTGESNPVKCIGSRCMQWRWLDDEIMKHTEYRMTLSMSSTPEQAKKAFLDDVPVRDMIAAGWVATDQAIPATGVWCLTLTKPFGAGRRGYCGLAGKP